MIWKKRQKIRKSVKYSKFLKKYQKVQKLHKIKIKKVLRKTPSPKHVKNKGKTYKKNQNAKKVLKKSGNRKIAINNKKGCGKKIIFPNKNPKRVKNVLEKIRIKTDQEIFLRIRYKIF